MVYQSSQTKRLASYEPQQAFREACRAWYESRIPSLMRRGAKRCIVNTLRPQWSLQPWKHTPTISEYSFEVAGCHAGWHTCQISNLPPAPHSAFIPSLLTFSSPVISFPLLPITLDPILQLPLVQLPISIHKTLFHSPTNLFLFPNTSTHALVEARWAVF